MIICAAICMNTPNGVLVVPCYRHGSGRQTLSVLNKPLFDQVRLKGELVEGFIDHKGTFYDRKKAYTHAKRCGQLSASTLQLKKERKEDELYSEDLY